MMTIKFVDTHNMFAFLSKPTESDGFEQIVDFLNAHHIRVESSDDEEILGEDASKQEMRIDAIDADEEITLVNVQDDAEMFDVNVLGGDDVFVSWQNENFVEEVVDAARDSKSTTTIVSSQQSQDKGKEIRMKEPVKPKKKDQIRLDEEVALKLQAEFNEEERLARERAKKQKANIDLIET
nr:hypothetical protein [Tanacetum cinerariifolium]